MDQKNLETYLIKPFSEFASIENLFAAWKKFRTGKQGRPDVLFFERRLEDELDNLSRSLLNGTYRHSSYHTFYVRDPKYRMIHKAQVRDRVVHQALFDVIYPVFKKRFFFDSYSSRINKGTYAAIHRLHGFVRKASLNFNREAWILHGDVDNFFASVDHNILMKCIARRINDKQYLSLCRTIIESLHLEPGKGVPLGNLTSQVFANIYLHQLDYFVKQRLGIKHYARYNDDFFIVADNKQSLVELGLEIREFLAKELELSMPEDKTVIRSLSQGVDVLGAVMFSHGLVPRKRLRRASQDALRMSTMQGYTLLTWRKAVSYLGLLGHFKAYWLQEQLRTALPAGEQS